MFNGGKTEIYWYINFRDERSIMSIYMFIYIYICHICKTVLLHVRMLYYFRRDYLSADWIFLSYTFNCYIIEKKKL